MKARGGQLRRDIQWGLWWSLMAWAGCRLLGAVGQLGSTVAVAAGLSSQTLVLETWFLTPVPLPSLVGGLVVLTATLLLQTGLLCSLAWLARPLQNLAMGLWTALAVVLLAVTPLVQSSVHAGVTLGISQSGSAELAAFSVAQNLVNVAQVWLGPIPLVAGLIVIAIRLGQPDAASS